MMLTVDWDTHDLPHNRHILAQLTASLDASQRLVAITGAGISVSAGIPDFRSADGLYARVLATESALTSKSIKGKDFFDAALFHNAETRPLFNKFVAELRTMCSAGEPTPTHQFLSSLVRGNRLIRWYTQNIDGLEKALGLKTSTCSKPSELASLKSSKVPVISLHGTLDRLVCTLCKITTEFDAEHDSLFRQGESPTCSKCTVFSTERQARGRRAVRCGVMRPDIVLYNEPHPHGEMIAEYLTLDMNRRPNLLLVMGTSLKVVGLKKMVKDLARAVHQQPGGLVIFINKTPAPRSEWKSVFDYELIGECDQWIIFFTSSKPTISLPTPPFTPSPRKTIMSLSPHADLPKRDGRINQLFRVVRKATPIASDLNKVEEVGKSSPLHQDRISVASIKQVDPSSLSSSRLQRPTTRS